MTRDELNRKIDALRKELDALPIAEFAKRYLEVMQVMPPRGDNRATLTERLLLVMRAEIIRAENEGMV